MIRDKHGESVFDYAKRFASPSFIRELERKLLQNQISNGRVILTKVEITRLLLLVEEYAFKFIWHLRLSFSLIFILFLVYLSVSVNMITLSFGVAVLLL